MSRNHQRRSLREMTGKFGEHAIREGWGVIHLGPLSRAIIERFMVKLGKALYYRHVGKLLDGTVYMHHIDYTSKNFKPEFLDHMVELAPEVVMPQRANKALADQFIYRCNCSIEFKIIHAIVKFSEQFTYFIAALSREMQQKVLEKRAASGQPALGQGVIDVPLRNRPVDWV